MPRRNRDKNVRRYGCKCGYATDLMRSFVGHMRVHSDERPFICECGASYRLRHHLKDHQKRRIITIDQNNQKVIRCRPMKKRATATNPNDGKSRPWKCVCGSTFKWKHLLASHKRGRKCPHQATSPTRSPPKDDGNVGANILHERNVDIRSPEISSTAPASPCLGGGSESVVPGSTAPNSAPCMAQPVSAYLNQYTYSTVPGASCPPSTLQPVPSLVPVPLNMVPYVQWSPEPYCFVGENATQDIGAYSISRL